MNIQLIWAQDTNAAIGKDGTLPWHYSEDLKNFKKLTTGHTIIMGRKTWDSLPIKPLPNRKNIVISSTEQTGVDSYNSIDTCMEYLEKNQSLQNIFVIGGMSIYKHFYDERNLYISAFNFNSGDTNLKWEISRNGEYFPHYYGILSVSYTHLTLPTNREV